MTRRLPVLTIYSLFKKLEEKRQKTHTIPIKNLFAVSNPVQFS